MARPGPTALCLDAMLSSSHTHSHHPPLTARHRMPSTPSSRPAHSHSQVTSWDFDTVIPAHFDAPIAAGPTDLADAFDFLRTGRNEVGARHAPRATRHAPRATRHAPRATRHDEPP